MIVAFGNCSDGQLAVGSTDKDFLPLPVPLVATAEGPDLTCVSQISCGSHHSLFLFTDGLVYSCGNNDSSQLGHEGPRRKLGLVPSLSTFKVVQIACGQAHSLALTKDGCVFSWGSNEHHQLGIGFAIAASSTAKRVPLCGVVQIASGANHCLALQNDGRLFSWGRNSEGQLGLGNLLKVDRPQEIKSIHGIPLQMIACGENYSIGLSMSGAVFSWGQNKFGQLGIGNFENRCYPVQVKTLRNVYVVNICCGSAHTAVLTKDGRLFTFGAASYGQLGNNSTQTNESSPKQIIDLMGLSVNSVACGRCHTLALLNKKLYAFGLNGNGQLGLGSTQSRSTPTVINNGQRFDRIYAGGDHSFALYFNGDDIAQLNELDTKPQTMMMMMMIDDSKLIKRLSLSLIKHIMCKSAQLVRTELEDVISSLTCINASFLKDNFQQYRTSRNNSGVEMDDVRSGFELLEESAYGDSFKKTITDCVERRILASEINLKPIPDVEVLRVFIILPWTSGFSSPERFKTTHLPFAQALLDLAKLPLEVIENWWSSFELRHFNRILKVYKNAVIYILQSDTLNENQLSVRIFLDLLAKLSKVNMATKKLSFESFYIDDLINKTNIRQDYCQFALQQDEQKFSFCRYPFIFNAAAKTMLLETDAAISQQIQMHQSTMQSWQSIFAPFFGGSQPCPFLILTVSRKNLVQDAMNQLALHKSSDLRKPLKIVFQNEEADDAGGVKKEFFMLLFTEVLQPKYGMFIEYDESRKVWFSPTVFEGDLEIFHVIGVFCGLAIYNGIIVALPFPLALYKKLLEQPVSLEDLKELCPTEGKSLESLLDYEGDDFDDIFSLCFEISIASFGSTKNVELKPGGSAIQVTKSNRHEYVDLYVDQKLNSGVSDQFTTFSLGFHRAVASRVLHFFQPLELMEMVVGNEHYDWDEFEKVAEYKGDYWLNHPTIKLFWKVFRSFTLDQKKKFLLFLTGSDRVPLLGMKEIKIFIQPTQSGEKYFPVAHTCFNLLDLPRYSEEATLRNRLLAAIEHTQGFTLV